MATFAEFAVERLKKRLEVMSHGDPYVAGGRFDSILHSGILLGSYKQNMLSSIHGYAFLMHDLAHSQPNRFAFVLEVLDEYKYEGHFPSFDTASRLYIYQVLRNLSAETGDWRTLVVDYLCSLPVDIGQSELEDAGATLEALVLCMRKLAYTNTVYWEIFKRLIKTPEWARKELV